MLKELQSWRQWRQDGKHLPRFLRDFHDQKEVFKGIHEMFGEQDANATVKRPSWVEGHCYVIDYFLWVMARHGYTLQRSRAKVDFESLDDNLKILNDRRNALLAGVLGLTLVQHGDVAVKENDVTS